MVSSTVKHLIDATSLGNATCSSLFVGVDPGLSGALAFFDPARGEAGGLSIVDMPTREVVRNGKRRRMIDALKLRAIFNEHVFTGAGVSAYVEYVGAMPGQGVTSMFSFGRAVGALDGIFGAYGITPIEVLPRVWQRALNLDTAKGDKAQHRERAARLYPEHASLFARKKDDGRADAALILTYGRLQEQ